jgi:hypothetical protein
LWPVALLTFLPGVAALGRRWYPGERTPAAGDAAPPATPSAEPSERIQDLTKG